MAKCVNVYTDHSYTLEISKHHLLHKYINQTLCKVVHSFTLKSSSILCVHLSVSRISDGTTSEHVMINLVSGELFNIL